MISTESLPRATLVALGKGDMTYDMTYCSLFKVQWCRLGWLECAGPATIRMGLGRGGEGSLDIILRLVLSAKIILKKI